MLMAPFFSFFSKGACIGRCMSHCVVSPRQCICMYALAYQLMGIIVCQSLVAPVCWQVIAAKALQAKVVDKQRKTLQRRSNLFVRCPLHVADDNLCSIGVKSTTTIALATSHPSTAAAFILKQGASSHKKKGASAQSASTQLLDHPLPLGLWRYLEQVALQSPQPHCPLCVAIVTAMHAMQLGHSRRHSCCGDLVAGNALHRDCALVFVASRAHRAWFDAEEAGQAVNCERRLLVDLEQHKGQVAMRFTALPSVGAVVPLTFDPSL